MSARPATHRVAILIVTHDDAADLSGCLDAVRGLDHRPLEVVIVDCASRDDSVAVARGHDLGDVGKTLVALSENRGFAGGMNEAIRRTSAPYVLTLNADARPTPGYLTHLLPHVTDASRRVGAATGRLVRMSSGGGPPLLDACGMRLTRAWRHLDRGSGEVDRGQYDVAERVFGATGAASLFARTALDDVRFPPGLHPDDDVIATGAVAAQDPAGAVFDPDFHTFREDAELCFRLQERGWSIVYEPAAIAEHRRFNLPTRRRSMPALANYNSLKNRYLLRLYHQTPGNLLRTLVPTLVRDLLALGYVLLRERSSLPVYPWLWRHRRRLLARRRWIQGRRSESVDRWFEVDSLPL